MDNDKQIDPEIMDLIWHVAGAVTDHIAEKVSRLTIDLRALEKQVDELDKVLTEHLNEPL